MKSPLQSSRGQFMLVWAALFKQPRSLRDKGNLMDPAFSEVTVPTAWHCSHHRRSSGSIDFALSGPNPSGSVQASGEAAGCSM